MRVSTKKFAAALYESLKDPQGGKPEEIIKNFVRVLADNGMVGRYEKIISDFMDYHDQMEGIIKVNITTSRDMGKVNEKMLAQKLEKTLGKKIEIETEVDQSILGGMIIQYDDKVMDGSIKRQLEILQKQLTQ
ncbi:MAG: ATP synthase subunit delta [Parcubacteria group bacterium GW2011_GWA2_38_13]|nr:MAG: ATP synthase subunit delta [Parcubacteria group bacterium GW2011_GWA2_38_13]